MKSAFILLGSACASLAQTALYDTSILKKGNTWTYAVDVEEYSTGQLMNAYEGTTRFTVDSVLFAADTVHFRVVQRDSLHYETRSGRPLDSTLSATTMTHFALTSKGVSPHPPVFYEGQIFSDTARRAVWRGDTVRLRKTEPYPNSCGITRNLNLEGVGRVYAFDSWFCGTITSRRWEWTLVEFKGESFSGTDWTPVSLAARVDGLRRKGAPSLEFGGGSVRIEGAGGGFDLRGRAAPHGRNISPAAP